MQVKIKYIIGIIALLTIWSCDDIIEEDITNDNVIIISPTSNQTITGNSVQFSWQTLDGADNYRIQINNNQASLLDTLVSGTTFNFGLNSGDYSWRIKGENFAYKTDYTFPINFSVQASDDLTTQMVILNTPSNNIYSNIINTIYTWESIETADFYEFELIKNTTTSQTIYQESNITSTSITLNTALFNEDAEYQWKVKAHNSTSSTQTVFSERSYFLDTQSPSPPTIVSPMDESTEQTSTTITFNWSLATDSGIVQSELSSEIEIATDINFTAIIENQATTTTSFQNVFNTVGDYYWRVKTTDLAGNESIYSDIRI